ncbi:hydroxymethylglutaryl-CoA lyase [Chelatococcus asaccharovorans]|uniref:Hydroxymethylglutaryl-CoA lyase n=1 Tax=Chelatococcus asaccharovorans TaxID=28210 RepID=A0A2V3TZA9_9HYPH|nr:hydroxymethylglutaryl-CoA lyase [Chelatococcus asaccharovorans]MBS7707773.1 hydroxymethylglutaryl-CoA lyase [Chelatococcus asaccharovorans]PXW55070.1 hydroxymethylglutaryl-CoA lyase [Chelatococcus asaccharovorans]
MTVDVTVVEVAPRDGFQSLRDIVPTQEKIEIVEALAAAGFARMEIGAFVSPRALPQMTDAAAVAAACLPRLDACRPAALVPNRRGAAAAIAAGLRELVFVLSVCERHNRANVGCDTARSVAELAGLVAEHDAELAHLRIDLATSFDSPFEGAVPMARTLELMRQVLTLAPHAEICLCDTTGRAFPSQVRALFDQAMRGSGAGGVAFHPHDTYGFAIANVLAAAESGVRVFDAAAGGLGGCPFAPGATGNAASEDVAFALACEGLQTGLDPARLLAAADRVAALGPAAAAGHLRTAPRARLLEDWTKRAVTFGSEAAPRERYNETIRRT